MDFMNLIKPYQPYVKSISPRLKKGRMLLKGTSTVAKGNWEGSVASTFVSLILSTGTSFNIILAYYYLHFKCLEHS